MPGAVKVPPVPEFISGWDDPSKLRDAELAQLAWQVEHGRQAQHEQERWRPSPAPPPMGNFGEAQVASRHGCLGDAGAW